MAGDEDAVQPNGSSPLDSPLACPRDSPVTTEKAPTQEVYSRLLYKALNGPNMGTNGPLMALAALVSEVYEHGDGILERGHPPNAALQAVAQPKAAAPPPVPAATPAAAEEQAPAATPAAEEQAPPLVIPVTGQQAPPAGVTFGGFAMTQPQQQLQQHGGGQPHQQGHAPPQQREREQHEGQYYEQREAGHGEEATDR